MGECVWGKVILAVVFVGGRSGECSSMRGSGGVFSVAKQYYHEGHCVECCPDWAGAVSGKGEKWGGGPHLPSYKNREGGGLHWGN